MFNGINIVFPKDFFIYSLLEEKKVQATRSRNAITALMLWFWFIRGFFPGLGLQRRHGHSRPHAAADPLPGLHRDGHNAREYSDCDGHTALDDEGDGHKAYASRGGHPIPMGGGVRSSR